MGRPLIVSRSEAGPTWSERLPNADIRCADSVPGDLAEFDTAWIDATGMEPLEVARTISDRDPLLQTVIVAPPEDMGIHRRTMLFTPGLGEVWLTGPDAVDGGLLERAREVTGTRRRYRGSRERMSEALDASRSHRPARAIVSDAYLAALLQVLPDPVLSVDPDGRIVSWSDSGERVLGVPRRAALGRPVLEVLGPVDPAAFERALEEARRETVSLDLPLEREGRRLVTEAVITPVHAGGLEVRSLVLRDVTKEHEARERLQKAVEMRSRFYAAMSHEIRTPINAIMGYNELLRTGAGAPEERDRYLERSQRAANHLLELVNDVLDLSKLESGGLEIQREPVRVGDLLYDLVATLDPIAREQETPLELDCDADAEVLNTDARRLKQVLMNLVTNAIKFGKGKPVVIRCSMQAGEPVFEVVDQGIGIEPEDMERVFEEFAQARGTEGGTGLGLPISRKLTELLGGRLTAESEPGRGSTFRVVLPAP